MNREISGIYYKGVGKMKRKVELGLSCVWLLLCYAAICTYIAKCGTAFIDSDMSSEMVLSKLISQEGGVLSKSWYYSTELRVLNIQLVLAPLFHVFDSWQTVRTVGSAILLALLAATYIFMARGLNISLNTALLSAGVLMLPLSGSYTYSVLTGLFYIPHVCISFVLFGLLCRYSKCSSQKKSCVLLAVTAAISLIAGLGGVRQLFVFMAPAAAAAVLGLLCKIKEEDAAAGRKILRVALISLAAAFIGLAVNKLIFPGIYSFCDYGNNTYGRTVLFESFSFESLEFCISSILELCGFKTGAIFSGYLIYNLLCAAVFLAAALSIRQLLKDREFDYAEKYTAIYLLCGLALLAAAFCFTDMDKITRYFVPVLAFALPCICMCLEKIKLDGKIKKSCTAVLLALFALCSLNTYRQMFPADTNTELKNVVSYLEQEGFTEGYSSFWNGNIITELSDGKIEMRIVSTDLITERDDMQYVYKWLQNKSHTETVPDSRFFLILSAAEDENCGLDQSPIYRSDIYTIYAFDSYEDFSALWA